MTKNLSVMVEWPEYQELTVEEGFEENSHYCPDIDAYFIDAEWYKNINA